MEAIDSAAVLAGGGTVITATHRLARQIRWRHDQAQAASGLLAWPSPDVLPLDAWLRRTWESSTLRDSPLARLRLLSDDEARLVWRRVLSNHHEGEEDRLDAGVIIPLAAAGWRLCQAWRIPITELRAAADSEDCRAFANWADAYRDVLERRGWLDNGELLNALARAAEDRHFNGEKWIGFAGFEPWTPALAHLANALELAGTTVATIAPPERAGTRQIVAARDESDEFVRACHWAAGYARPDSGATVAIVLPNLERDAGRARRIGMDVLAPGWQLHEPPARPVALAAGRQLADYPIVFCALTLLRLLATEVTFDQASYLLRSCYLAQADRERAGRARAELKLRRLPLERILLRTLLGLLDDASQTAGQWRRAESLSGKVCSRRLPPSQWAGHFSAWLTAAGWPGDRGLASEEYQAAEAWQRLLESFAGTDEVAGSLPLVAALGILAQQARDRPFEPESPAGAVQVLSLREAEGQDFSALWVCGLTADQWPPPPRPHPLIPLALQQAANIPEASAVALEAHTRRRFEKLLACADHLVLSWAAEQDETETLPSPLLASPLLADSPTASSRAEESALHPDRQRVADSAQAEVVAADPPPAWPPGGAVTGGSRVLAMQAVCPARAFVEFRLRGSALEAPARPLDRATRGRVVHRLLERLYRIDTCSRGLGQIDTNTLRDVLAPLISTVLDEFLPAGDTFLASLRPLESDRLWALVLSIRNIEMERSGFQVVTEVARQVSIGPLALSIRLDRLDRLDEGGELVIDYKTGRFEPAGWKRPRLPESQLPLYAVTARSRGVAVVQLRPPGARLRGVGDDALGISGIKSATTFFRDDGLDWPGALLRWQSQLENLAMEFTAGDFRVDPADRQWATGQFAGLTRIYEFLPVADEADSPHGADE